MSRRSKHPSKMGQPRSVSDLIHERRESIRSSRSCVLIVCEGLKTEKNYFEALKADLKLGLVDVQVEGEGCAPITVVRRAIEARDERIQLVRRLQRKGLEGPLLFDEVWCVFDTERIDINPSFHQAVDLARGNNLSLAISNPAFEYWYLLHFRNTTQPFANAADLLKSLKVHLPNYQKNMDIYKDISNLTDTALERARNILSNHPDKDAEFPNPSTSVCRLVEKLILMKK